MQNSSGEFSMNLIKEGNAKVAEALRTQTVMANPDNPNLVWKKEESGNSSRFMRAAWSPRPDDYVVGSSLAGQAFGFADLYITLDPKPILAHRFLAKHHRRMADWEVADKVLNQCVDEVMRELDRRAFLIHFVAARSSTTVTDSNGVLTLHNGPNRLTVQDGTSLANAFPTTPTGAATLRDKIAQLRQMANEDDLPVEGSKMYITPYAARVLGKDTGVFDMTLSQNMNPNNLTKGVIGMIEGFEIILVPGTDRIRNNVNINSTTGANGFPTRYQGNFTRTTAATGGDPVAIATFRGPEGTSPVGIRQVGPVDIEDQYIVGDQGNHIAVAIHVGMDKLDTNLVGSIEVTSD